MQLNKQLLYHPWLNPFCVCCSFLHRLAKAAAALSERGNLLASMHWSLPRPTSKAEQQMSRHLEVSERIFYFCFPNHKKSR